MNRLVPAVVPLERGDVIVFRDPGGWLEGGTTPPKAEGAVQQILSKVNPFGTDDDDHLVKRVIGLPGDRVACCDPLGRMTVDGAALDEPYAVVPAGYSRVSQQSFDTVVPPKKLWVMGDNRYDSSDSRAHQDTPSKGFVPISDVTGRAFVVSWPITRWSWLSNSPSTFEGVPAPKR